MVKFWCPECEFETLYESIKDIPLECPNCHLPEQEKH